jgi:outer membrane protein OmpA-like peptidoglycan-associated protein
MPAGNHLFGVSGTSRENVLAVGQPGILKLQGSSWTVRATTAYELFGIWSSSPDAVVAVGNCGLVVRWDGSQWSVQESGTDTWLLAVWGSGPDDVFAAGRRGTVLHWNGASWSPMTTGSAAHLFALWGSGPRDVFAAGSDGVVLHWDGRRWSQQASGTHEYLYGLWGSGPNHVIAVGTSGTILRFDGSLWTRQDSHTTEHLYAVWGTGANAVVSVGARGTVVRDQGHGWEHQLDGDAALYGVSAIGSDAFIAVGQRGTTARFDDARWTTDGPEAAPEDTERGVNTPHLRSTAHCRLPESNENVSVAVATFYFYRNSSRPIQDFSAEGMLREVVDGTITVNPILVLIEGYTAGREESGNDYLALERAQRMSDLLVARGLSPELLRIRSAGDAPEVVTASVDRMYHQRVRLIVFARRPSSPAEEP